MNFYAEIMEKIMSWERSKICGGGAAVGGQARILSKIKCIVHLEIARLMLNNASINVLFSISFGLGTVVGGLSWN